MIIDALVYLGESLFGYGQSLAEILANMDRLEIDQAILVPVKPRAYHLGPMNELVADAARRHPDRFHSLCRVDPWQREDALAETQRGFEVFGACGLYLDPWEENFQANHGVVEPVLEEAIRYRKPVVFNAGHVRVSHPVQIWDVASRFPNLPIVAANGGQINICGILLSEARAMLEACPNVIIGSSGTYREDFIEDVATEVGAGRVIFASRSPIYDQEFEMARVRLAHLDPALKQQLWSENAVGLFGLGPRAG